jgi:hypothetical protein
MKTLASYLIAACTELTSARSLQKVSIIQLAIRGQETATFYTCCDFDNARLPGQTGMPVTRMEMDVKGKEVDISQRKERIRHSTSLSALSQLPKYCIVCLLLCKCVNCFSKFHKDYNVYDDIKI